MLFLYSDAIVLDNRLNSVSRGAEMISRRDVKRSRSAHGIHCVCDDVGENLDHLAFAGDNLLQVVEAGVHRNVIRQKLCAIDGKYSFDQTMQMNLYGRTRISVVTQRLASEVRDTL